MCDHPPAQLVIDCHEGTQICRQCAHVLDTNLSTNDIFPPQSLAYTNSFSLIDDIGYNNHINGRIIEHAKKVFNDLKLQFKKRSEFDLSVYSVFIAAILEKNPYTIEEISNMLNTPIKSINGIIKSINKLTDYQQIEHEEFINPSVYLDRFTQTLLNHKDRIYIKKNFLAKLPDLFLLKIPKLVIAGVTYHYLKLFGSKNNHVYLNRVNEHLKVNKRQIVSIERKIHSLLSHN